MKVNKAWFASVIVYILTELVKHFDLQLPDGWENEAFNIALFVVQYGSFLAAALWNKFANNQNMPTQSELVKETAAAVQQQTPASYAELEPYIKEVHEGINAMYQDVKSGKYTDATQDAINKYMEIYNALKQKKGA